jgi:hypothetical protein
VAPSPPGAPPWPVAPRICFVTDYCCLTNSNCLKSLILVFFDVGFEIVVGFRVNRFSTGYDA